MTTKPKRGRPAPLGRKVVCSVRLTPDVAETMLALIDRHGAWITEKTKGKQ